MTSYYRELDGEHYWLISAQLGALSHYTVISAVNSRQPVFINLRDEEPQQKQRGHSAGRKGTTDEEQGWRVKNEVYGGIFLFTRFFH